VIAHPDPIRISREEVRAADSVKRTLLVAPERHPQAGAAGINGCGLTQADEGTRTLDLLRGKQTLQPTELHPRRRGLPRKEDLMTIKAEDILAGSLFGDEERESPGR
jgi:hypothetical protein